VGAAGPRVTRAGLLARAEAAARRRLIRIDGLRRDAGDLLEAPIETRDVPLLTDDYAPTDALITAGR